VVELTAKAEMRLADMSDKQLMDAWDKVGKEYTILKDKLMEFSEEHQRREQEKQFAVRLGTLSDPERTALQQYINAQGVESAEDVVGPGNG
jgi:hypothetical protein